MSKFQGSYHSKGMPGDEIRTEPLVIVRNVDHRSLQSPSPKSSRQQRKFFAGFFQISRIFSVLEPRSRATEECKKARTHLSRVKTRPLLTARRRGTPSLPYEAFICHKKPPPKVIPPSVLWSKRFMEASVEAHETTTFSDGPARWRACFRPSELHNRRRTTRELQIRGKRF